MTGAPDLDRTLGELRHLAGPSYPQRSKASTRSHCITDLLMSIALVALIAGVIVGAI